MLEILRIGNETTTIKINHKQKEILAQLGLVIMKNKTITIFNTPYALNILLKYSDNKTLKQMYEQKNKQWKQLQNHKVLPDYEGDSKLRPYQRVDVAILKQHPRFGLFNEMRTGKTPTILTALQEMETNKVLFIVPKSTILLTWVPELEKWTNYQCIVIKNHNIKARTLKYQTFANTNNCALVVSKNTFKNDIKNNLISKFDFTLVIDEAHFLRNYKTAQTTTILTIANAVKSVYCLTGTPANNHPSDIFGILKIIDNKLYENMDYWTFVNRYFGIIKKRITKFTTINLPKPHLKPQLSAEFDYLVKKISIMRKQVDIRQEMPRIIKTDLALPMTKIQKMIYKDTLASMKQEIYYQKNSKMTFLQIFTKLRTICTTPINEGSKDFGAKFKWVIDYLQDNEIDAVIIYSSFSEKGLNILSNILLKQGIAHHLITGKTHGDERLKIVNDFQNGFVKIILCNIKTVNVGVTLDKADVMIFLDRELNPTENEQAENRFFPTKLDDSKTRQIINLHCQNTIDLKIKNLLNTKIDINKIISEQGIKFFE